MFAYYRSGRRRADLGDSGLDVAVVRTPVSGRVWVPRSLEDLAEKLASNCLKLTAGFSYVNFTWSAIKSGWFWLRESGSEWVGRPLGWWVGGCLREWVNEWMSEWVSGWLDGYVVSSRTSSQYIYIYCCRLVLVDSSDIHNDAERTILNPEVAGGLRGKRIMKFDASCRSKIPISKRHPAYSYGC